MSQRPRLRTGARAAVAALALLLTTACAGQGPEAVYGANWNGPTQTPKNTNFYPPAAQRADIAGMAALNCYLEQDGRLTDCRLAFETPPGYGFGQAALRMYSSVTVRMSEAERVAAHADKTHFRVLQPVIFATDIRGVGEARAAWAAAKREIIVKEFGPGVLED